TFSECDALTTVVIGNDVTIGDHAFSMNKDTAFKVLQGGDENKKYFYYEYSSPLTSLTIGNNAVIGESAFNNAASLESVTLGEGAELGKMAFYNTSGLKNIDLSKVKSFGDYAISGDVYYACLDDGMTVADVTSEGMYRYTYHGPKITSIDISSAKSIGEYTFSYCRELVDFKLGEKITEIPKYAFAGCASLKNINLDKVETIDEYAFMECGLEKLDISACESVGDYGFVSNRTLANVTLNEKGTDIGEGTFSYCDPLKTVTNLNKSENIGDYAFAYDAITDIDLTDAVNIGKNSFMKETLTEVKVTLGEDIEKLGDNPFAMCKVKPFSSVATEKVNGEKKEVTVYDFELSDNVKVIDGSLYCKNGDGYELITFAGRETEDVVVNEETIRISALAFAGSDVVRVKIPFMTTAIGHKAFYACDKLEMVIFGSYNVPNFEEEFDPKYYETLDHIPGSGDYGEYVDYEGNEVTITGNGMLPYYMWNATDGQYFTVFYGANFIDYVGYVENKPMMVKPVNGVGYDSFICDQYFDLRIDGPAAPDKTSVEAIKLINAIPERVTADDKALVKAARAAFDKIATTEQQALVNNYSDLISAEQRIKALDSEKAEEDNEEVCAKKSNSGSVILVITVIVVVLAAAGLAGAFLLNKKNKKTKKEADTENEKIEE
ncbi:MAG: leucine-rich repeat protein, partial [Clostridia bacterium]|nr:leucine-rich repeat protein [Clostridia bacterium]